MAKPSWMNPAKPTAKPIPSVYRTQKVRGIVALRDAGYNVPTFEVLQDPTREPKQGLSVPRFARPCPPTPRHGFVDSRPVADLDTLAMLWCETLDAENDAEIVLMPILSASASAIWTRGVLTIGPGNDGATAGHGSYTLPAHGDLVKQSTVDTATVKANESPYVELVYDGQNPVWYVQLRGGIPATATLDTIPDKMTVAQVIEVSPATDWNEWEVFCKANAGKAIAVYHPGGSPTSHYSIHAKQAGFAVCVTFKPAVGDTLEPTMAKPEPDATIVRGGFAAGLHADISYTDAMPLLLGILHHAATWTEDHAAYLLGFGLGLLYRCIGLCCAGELRHAGTMKYGKGNPKPSRNAIYKKAWASWLTMRKAMESASGIFLDPHAFSQGGSFGGKKWAIVADTANTMYMQVCDLKAGEAIQTANSLIHLCHNGGWILNKLGQHEVMDTAASAPVKLLVPEADKLLVWLQTKPTDYTHGNYRLRKLKIPPPPPPPPPKPVCAPVVIVSAQACVEDSGQSGMLHVQVQYKKEDFTWNGETWKAVTAQEQTWEKSNVKVSPEAIQAVMAYSGAKQKSYISGAVKYVPLTVNGYSLYCGETEVVKTWTPNYSGQ